MNIDLSWLLNLITFLVMLVGLLGLIIPIFPGGLVIGVAALFYGLIVGITGWGWFWFLLIIALAIGSTLADNIMMSAKAHEAGGSWKSILVAIVAALIVSIPLTPIAGLVAAPLALYGAEYYRTKDREIAGNVTKALMLGWGWAFVVRFGLGVVKIVLWGIWAAQIT